MNIAIYVTGDRTHGMGHIYRTVVLAKTLLSRGHLVSFVTHFETAGMTVLRREGFSVIGAGGYGEVVMGIKNTLADIVLIDVEHGPERRLLQNIGKICPRIVVLGGVGFDIHDQSAIDELVDLQVYQSPVITELFSRQTGTNALYGTEYLILDEAYSNARAARELNQTHFARQHLLVSMGGADPHALTPHVATLLAEAFPAQSVVAVYGPASQHVSRKGLPHNVVIIESPPPQQFAQLMAESSLVVTALGMTVYEALCVGVPVCCTAWSEDHEATAHWLENRNALAYVGRWDEFDTGSMLAFAYNVIALDTYREQKVAAGYRLVDGRGKERVAEAIERLL